MVGGVITKLEKMVSIIIPIYNVEKYLQECIESVLQQSLQDIEIICVNDGSTDNSGVILEKFAETDKRILVINQENKGVSAARNTGLRCAKGKYIYFLDSDDYLAPDALELLSSDMDARNLDLLLFNAKVFGEKGVEEKRVQGDISYFKRMHEYPLIYKGEDLMRMLWENREYIATVFLQMVRRDFLNKHDIRFYENIIHEDEPYTFKVMLCAERVGYLDRVLYYRRVWENSIMGIDSVARLTLSIYSCILCLEQMIACFEKFPIRQENRKLIFKTIESVACSCKNRYMALPLKNRKEILQDSAIEDVYKALHRCGCTDNSGIIKDYGEGSLKKLLFQLEEDKTLFENKPETFNSLPLQTQVKPVVVVSVIIPAFNVERYFSDCIESVINQTFKDIEIICVNDGSTDGTYSLMQHYADLDDRIVIVNESINRGPSFARNVGLAKAQGEYIYFLDSDDFIDLNAIGLLVEEMKKTGVDILYFNADVFGDSDVDDKKLNSQKIYFERKGVYPRICEGTDFFKLMWGNKEYIASVPLQFVRRDFLRKIKAGFIEGIIHEDEIYTLQVMFSAKKTGYLHKILYHRRVRPNSIMTSEISLYNVVGRFIATKEIIKICFGRELSKDVYTAVGEKIIRMINIMCNSYLQLGKDEREKTRANLIGDKWLFDILIANTVAAKEKLKRQTELLEKSRAELLKSEEQLNSKILLQKREIEDLNKTGSELRITLQRSQKQLQDAKQEIEKLKKDFVNKVKKCNEMKRYSDKALRELHNVKTGWSFRIGRVVTYIPRKIRDWLKH